MKKLIFGLLFGTFGLLMAQTSSQNFAISTPPASNITGVSYSNYTSPGQGNTYYYWVLTTYPGGSVLDPTPQQIDNVNGNDPSVGNPIKVSWAPTQGAISYSILKNTTGVSPVFPCTCLVATVSSPITFVSDTGAALSGITPTFANTAKGSIRLNNSLYNPPNFEAEVNGIVTPFGGSAGLSPFVVSGNNVSLPLGLFTSKDIATKLTPSADVRAYGAKCDGITDDSAAFTAAHAALTYGGVLLVPIFNCKLNSSLVISNQGVILQGPGRSLWGPTQVPSLIFAAGIPGVVITAHGAQVRDIGIKSLDTVFTAGDYCIWAKGGHNTLENIDCGYFGDAQFMFGTTGVGTADLTTAINLEAAHGKGDGFKWVSNGDNNSSTYINLASVANAAIGYDVLGGASNTFISTYAEDNTGQSYYENGTLSNSYFNINCEGANINFTPGPWTTITTSIWGGCNITGATTGGVVTVPTGANGVVHSSPFYMGHTNPSEADKTFFYFAEGGGVGDSASYGKLQLTGIHNVNGGTGYVVGDIVTVTQAGGSGGQLNVTLVNAANGAVISLSLNAGGTGYTTGTKLATTGGTGTGLVVDIVAAAGAITSGTPDPNVGTVFVYFPGNSGSHIPVLTITPTLQALGFISSVGGYRVGATSFGTGGTEVIPLGTTGWVGSSTGKVELVSDKGSVALVSGTTTISSTASCVLGTSCQYKLTNCKPNASTAIGTLSIGTIVAGTSFVINSLSPTNTVLTGDVSTVCWQIN
jgi:hypothetical protein